MSDLNPAPFTPEAPTCASCAGAPAPHPLPLGWADPETDAEPFQPDGSDCGCHGSLDLPALPGGSDAWTTISPPEVCGCDADSIAGPQQLFPLVSGDEIPAEDYGNPLPVPAPPAAAGEATYLDLFEDLFQLLALRFLRKWSPPPKPLEVVGTGSGAEDDFYGTGLDGDRTVSTTEELDRDRFYRDLTITGTGRLKTNGYRLFVSRKLTIQSGGKIDANGAHGAAGSGPTGGAGGTGGGGGSSPRPFLARGGAGGAGGSFGGSGTTAGAGAAGGTGLLPTLAPGQLIAGCGGGGGGWLGSASGATAPVAGTSVLGAAGGDGGTSAAVASVSLGGGGGGGGGGVLLVFAREIDNAGSLEANGGNGGDGATGSGELAGGGAGGGGGAAILYYTTASGSGVGTVLANGGVGGVYGSTSSTNGITYTYQVNV